MSNILHYYGTLVRRLFLFGAIIMLAGLPFFNSLLPVPIFASVLAIILLSLVAGFTTPRRRSIIIIDEVIAVIAVLVFEYYAATYYIQYSIINWLFVINQLLAFIFLIALYYNTKTLREAILAS